MSRIEVLRIDKSGVFLNDHEIDFDKKVSDQIFLGDLECKSFIPNRTDWLKCSSNLYPGFILSVNNDSLDSCAIILKIRNSGIVEFEGNIFIEGRELPNPLKSIFLEEMFSGLRLNRDRSIYKNTFTPRSGTKFSISKNFDIEFITSRDAQFIGVIKIIPIKNTPV